MFVSDGVSKATNALLLVCALGMTGLVAKRELFTQPAQQGQDAPLDALRILDSTETLTQSGTRLGAGGAVLTLVEFSDFQCPFCARAAKNIAAFREAHPNQLAIIYHHLPLEKIHPYAIGAALAAECAGDQGRFEALHDRLYAEQGEIGKKSWAIFAAEAGVTDTVGLKRCIAAQTHSDRIAGDMELARGRELGGTPAFVVRGKLYQGAPPLAQLASWLAAASQQ